VLLKYRKVQIQVLIFILIAASACLSGLMHLVEGIANTVAIFPGCLLLPPMVFPYGRWGADKIDFIIQD